MESHVYFFGLKMNSLWLTLFYMGMTNGFVCVCVCVCAVMFLGTAQKKLEDTFRVQMCVGVCTYSSV
jgi:hypothetical protein